MIQWSDYRKPFYAALSFHLVLAIVLSFELTSSRPVLTAATKTELSRAEQVDLKPEEQAIKAVSIDKEEVLEAVNRLKEEQLKKRQIEDNRQRMLTQKAEALRQQRQAEQKRLQKLKEEAAKLAIAREKKLAEEKKRLQELAKQKQEQEKNIAEIKRQKSELLKQRQQEAAKLSALQKQKAKEIQEQKQKAAAQQAALDARKSAEIQGVVDKYKALIINSISRQWILPDNVNSGLSSQFRIRLAPNGSVLEVTLTRSSGDSILDRSAQAAIYKASPLPVPSDPSTFNIFRDISLTVRPENVRG